MIDAAPGILPTTDATGGPAIDCPPRNCRLV